MRALGSFAFALVTALAAQPSAAQWGATVAHAQALDCTLRDLHGKTFAFDLSLDEQDGIVAEMDGGINTKFKATFAPKSITYQRFSGRAEIDRVNGAIRITPPDEGVPKVEGTCSVARSVLQQLSSRL